MAIYTYRIFSYFFSLLLLFCQVNIDRGVLTIEGHHQDERREEDPNRRFLRVERQVGHVRRALRLPDNVKHAKHVNARYEHGVLKVRKKEERKERIIKYITQLCVSFKSNLFTFIFFFFLFRLKYLNRMKGLILVMLKLNSQLVVMRQVSSMNKNNNNHLVMYLLKVENPILLLILL